MASVLTKSLTRLSRSQLIDLALHWLDNPSTCPPYLAGNRTLNESDEEDYLFPPARSQKELKAIYKELRLDDIDASKSYVVDRIIDGDWRRGLSLYQHATIDFAHLTAHDTAVRWTALKLVPLEHSHSTSEPPNKKRKHNHQQPLYPTISPTSFLHTLRAQVSPLIKAHYHLTTLSEPYNLPIIRIYLTPHAPFAPLRSNIPRSARQATDSGRVLYIALPHGSPHVYISTSGSSSSVASTSTQKPAAKTDTTSLKRLLLTAIPKALSRPHERWALESTNLTARSLRAVCALRGGTTRPGTAGGAFAVFHHSTITRTSSSTTTTAATAAPASPSTSEYGTREADPSPVDVLGLSAPPAAAAAQPTEENDMFFPSPSTHPQPASLLTKGTSNTSISPSTRRTRSLTARFGPDTPSRAHLDRLTARITDVMKPMGEARGVVDAAPVTVSFGGGDVVGGLRALAALGAFGGAGGAVDLARMPGWITGEQGTSVVVV